MVVWEAIFWASLALLAYAFLGYPVLVVGLATAFGRRTVDRPTSSAVPSSVTVVLCLHDEEERVRPRLENLFQLDHPDGGLDVVVVSDGSADGTVDAVRAFAPPVAGGRVECIVSERRVGKAQALNLALARARGEIVVFADARQRFLSETVRHLVERFTDPRVGAVSGSLEIQPSLSGTGAGVDTYWRLEKAVRRRESDLGITIGCTGAVYAIRRGLYEPLPPDTLLDDVLIPMRILVRGWRVEFEPRAVALDPQALEPARERVRKERTLAGNFQMLFRHPEWLLPWRNRAWWALISHKYLRLLAPVGLLSTAFANAMLVQRPFYAATLVGQCALYVLAIVGLCSRRTRGRIFSLPAGFLFLNGRVVAGFLRYVRGGTGAWERAGQTPKEGVPS